jgi:hypothetical protein
MLFEDRGDSLLPALRFYNIVAVTGKSSSQDTTNLGFIINNKYGGVFHFLAFDRSLGEVNTFCCDIGTLP